VVVERARAKLNEILQEMVQVEDKFFVATTS
jgi:hypothetical protein